MSVFCPKCQKRTYNEYICDLCQYEIKKKPMINPLDQYSQNSRSFNIRKELESNPLNVIIAIAVSIIAIIGIYFAYNKYQENRQVKRLMVKTFGTDDMDEIIDNQDKMMKKASQDYERAMREMNRQIQGIGKQ